MEWDYIEREQCICPHKGVGHARRDSGLGECLWCECAVFRPAGETIEMLDAIAGPVPDDPMDAYYKGIDSGLKTRGYDYEYTAFVKKLVRGGSTVHEAMTRADIAAKRNGRRLP